MNDVVRQNPQSVTPTSLIVDVIVTVVTYPVVVSLFLAAMVFAYSVLDSIRNHTASSLLSLLLLIGAAPYSLGVSAIVTAAALTFPGAGLSVAASWLLRKRTSTWVHLVAQFGAGVVTAAAVIAIYLFFSDTDLLDSGRLFMVTVAGIAILAGACAAIGWFTGIRWAEASPFSVQILTRPSVTAAQQS